MVINNRKHYPTKFARLVIYPLTFLVFISALAVVLLYANGYRFDLKDSRIVIDKTGMMIVSTRPNDAAITIDGKKTKKRTTFSFLPIKIADLLPKTYKISLSKDGYRTWTKDVSIKANLVSWINYILLFPNDLKITKNEDFAGRQILAQSNTNRFLFTYNPTEKAYYVNDLAENSSKKAWPPQTLDSTTSPIEINIVEASFNSNSSKLIVKSKNNENFDYYVLDFSSSDSKLSAVANLFKEPISKIEWDHANENELFILSAASLYRINVNNQSIPSPVLTEISNFSVDKTSVYAVTNQNILIRTNLDGSRSEVVSPVAKSTEYKILFSAQSAAIAVLEKDSGILTVFHRLTGQTSSIRLGKNVKDFKWSDDGKKLYYYNDFEILRFDWEKQLEVSSKSVDKIIKLDWYYDENHFIIQTVKELFVIDYDGTNKVVFSETPIGSFYLDQKSSSFIFSKDTEYFKFIGSF